MAKYIPDVQRLKERFKLVHETASFDENSLLNVSKNKISLKNQNKKRQNDAKTSQDVNYIRLKRESLKEALLKKYHKSVADKLMSALESNYSSMYQMNISNYVDMLQANFLSQTTVQKGFVVPIYFRLMFNLLDQGNKGYICEHDLFNLIQDLEDSNPESKRQSKAAGEEEDPDQYHEI